MNNHSKQDLAPLKLLKKYREVASESTESLLQQRMIYMASVLIESGHRCQEIDINQQIITFIQKMNAKVVGTIDLSFDQRINYLGKCFDILAAKNIRSLIHPFQKQLQLRALCLNNLSIVYKQHKQLRDSLKAVDQAINIEQILLQKQYPGIITSISSTYVNRCAILSALNNHQQAAQTIIKSLKHLGQYLDIKRETLSKKDAQDLEYTMMFAHFNLAVEYQHLGLSKLAVQHFEIAYQQAKQLGDWQLRDKVVEALKSLRKK